MAGADGRWPEPAPTTGPGIGSGSLQEAVRAGRFLDDFEGRTAGGGCGAGRVTLPGRVRRRAHVVANAQDGRERQIGGCGGTSDGKGFEVFNVAGREASAASDHGRSGRDGERTRHVCHEQPGRSGDSTQA